MNDPIVLLHPRNVLHAPFAIYHTARGEWERFPRVPWVTPTSNTRTGEQLIREGYTHYSNSLPPLAPSTMRNLETENASLRVEVAGLKQRLELIRQAMVKSI